MESSPAGERKNLLNNLPARGLDLFLDSVQIARIDHQQHARAGCRCFGCKAAAQTAVVKAGVAGSVIFELPAENCLVETLRRPDIGRGQLDVVDLVLWFQASAFLYRARSLPQARSASGWL